MTFCFVYITNRNEEEASKIADHLISKKLAACAVTFPAKSTFRWKGKVEKTEEVLMLVKTTKENFEKIKTEVKKIHSYEVPCIVKLDVEGNKEYEEWLRSEL